MTGPGGRSGSHSPGHPSTTVDQVTGVQAAVSFDARQVDVVVDSSEGPRVILHDVNLTVHDGEFVSVMGRSGTGKTTLLRVLGGLLDPTSTSDVTFHGRRVEGPPEGVVLVFQNYAASLLPWRNVARNVALGLEGHTSKPEREERVREALAMVGLGERGADYPWQLSGGMQQRVQLARALAMRPSVLLMDEPFGALDAMTKGALQDELQQVQALTGTTVVFV
ncbi:MAG TPA: ATP-binding cassette domain-containing protein, partial [Acidimicrobiales bacterium]|nr:ATP-binding cassette domain-containing protein [Acidimicrobiales bacterium]